MTTPIYHFPHARNLPEILRASCLHWRVIDFWVTFSEVIIIVRRLIREAWTRYSWEV